MLGTEAGKKEVMISLVQRNTVNCLSDVTGSKLRVRVFDMEHAHNKPTKFNSSPCGFIWLLLTDFERQFKGSNAGWA